ncbi:hypothetical protein BDY21DRAFT_370087 [Lineolata rhizophorae]|uniref:Uncharacterized protein n=1 Tax=Lineolata rhizophorae TaxID=578093 RepID=A0A6A6P5L0_9PEZI|nr:hypothetical protein BDY21DRAFT_370087 [Lineolata rhizophorae]
MVWLRLLETWAVTRLLSSPAFLNVVRKAHRRYWSIRHGVPYEEEGGMNIDRNPRNSFFKHFVDEIKKQSRGRPSK